MALSLGPVSWTSPPPRGGGHRQGPGEMWRGLLSNRRRLLLPLGIVVILWMLFAEDISVRSRTKWRQNVLQDQIHGPVIVDDPVSKEMDSKLETATGASSSYHSDDEEKEIWKQEQIEEAPVPVSNEEEEENKRPDRPKKTKICTIALNPRQGSLFRTNYLGQVGSGKYRYAIKSECPWEERRVRLISYVKCCESLSKVTRTVNAATKDYDIVIVTGDEYCYTEDARPQFRQYWGNQIMATARNLTQIPNYTPNPLLSDSEDGGIRYPLYIPLGPREEFLQVRIDPKKDIVPPSKRKYLYSFLGSMTSYSRQMLKRVVAGDLATEEKQKEYPGFVHITDKWHLKVTKSNGYVEPDEYKQVLLQSVFTLCPTGHNPEAYRIYEALEAGSIPILAIDPWYERARCQDAFKPYKDAGAPFIYLNHGWKQLETFFERRGTNATWVKERQQMVIAWYKKWMHENALRFEAILEHRYKKRMTRTRETEQRQQEELAEEAEELEAIKREEEQDGNGNDSGLDESIHIDDQSNEGGATEDDDN